MNLKKFFAKKSKAKSKRGFKESFRLLLKKRREASHKRHQNFKEKLLRAGVTLESRVISKILLFVCIFLNFVISLYIIGRVSTEFGFSILLITISLLFIWLFIFALVLFIIWLFFYVSLDVAIFTRKKRLEAVLPDFLLLTSANIRAGMTIEQALWYAVRPRFGVLAREIEEVAKRTYSGEELEQALSRFVSKYDSKTLSRSISLLTEGVRAGGEVGELLSKIAENIQETNIMKKEMAANVMTYVIFITFATVVAAPFLFGLAVQLISVIQQIFDKANISETAHSSFKFSLSKSAVSLSDFKIFSVCSLAITSFFSGMIVSVIKTGTAHGVVRYFPTFFCSSVVIFFLVIRFFAAILGNMF